MDHEYLVRELAARHAIGSTKPGEELAATLTRAAINEVPIREYLENGATDVMASVALNGISG